MRNKIAIAVLFFSGLAFAQQSTHKNSNDSIQPKEIQSITLSKKVFQKKSDRFVFDVSSSPVAKGTKTLDLLKQTPLVSSTDDKSLQIVGKSNAIIYINGRKTNMDNESVMQFLKNTPAENIQKIEVITVPGSEYQVEASEGIINIVLKKKQTDGTSGNTNMSNTYNKYNQSSASFNLNYRKGPLGLNASLSGSDTTEAQYYILKNGNSKSVSESSGDVLEPTKSIGGYINMDYAINDKSNFALSWNSWNSRSYDSTVDLFNKVSFLDQNNNWEHAYTFSRNREDSRFYNNSWSANYDLITDSLGSKLNVNAAYLIYKRFQNANNNTFAGNADREQLGLIQQNLQNVPQKINNFSVTVDYIQKFDKDLTVSFGGNLNFTTTDNDTQSRTINFLQNTDVSNPNHFIYDENIYGLYATVEKKFSDKFSGKIGSRYEMTKSVGTSDNTTNPEMKRIERNYNKFLPYLSVNYAINKNHNLSYSFSTRVRRPSFWELNPVKTFLTDDNYIQNNPFVQASTSYNQELNYMLKNAYFLILNHTYYDNVITQVPLQKEIIKNGAVYNKLAYIRTNFGSKQEYSAVVGLQKAFLKQAWNANFIVGVQHNVNNGSLNSDPTTGEIFDTYVNKRKSTSLIIKSSNTIRLDQKKTWFLTANAFFMDKQQIELGELQAISSVDLGIKKIWNDWTFAVDFRDIFNTNQVKVRDFSPESGNFNYVDNNMFRRSATLTITYNFGNKQVQKARKVDSAASEIQNRTGK